MWDDLVEFLRAATMPGIPRLLLGTGGFRSLEAMAAAIDASGAELVTVALRRIDPGARVSTPQSRGEGQEARAGGP